MRKLLFVAALAAVLAPIGIGAPNALRISVSPEQGKQGTKFTVGFVADRELAGNRWYSIEVSAPEELPTCENSESATVAYVRRGQPVKIQLTPYDKFRWCPGEYLGIVRVDRRVRCGAGGIDRPGEYCSTNGSVVGRFRFQVAP